METGMTDPIDEIRDQVVLLSAEVALLRERLTERRESLTVIAEGVAELRVALDEHMRTLAKAREALRPGAEWELRERGL